MTDARFAIRPRNIENGMVLVIVHYFSSHLILSFSDIYFFDRVFSKDASMLRFISSFGDSEL